MTLVVEALDHMVANVRDVEVSAAWYQRVLGMTREEMAPVWTGRWVRFGRQKINLRPITASKSDWFTADNERAGSEDLCFLTRATPRAVVDHLRACGVVIEEDPGEKRGAVGTLVSVYCRDPDGSLIEISSYK